MIVRMGKRRKKVRDYVSQTYELDQIIVKREESERTSFELHIHATGANEEKKQPQDNFIPSDRREKGKGEDSFLGFHARYFAYSIGGGIIFIFRYFNDIRESKKKGSLL